jgi:hypothetical protein
MAYWVPHGLIKNQDLEECYQNAKFSVDAKGNSYDPKEYHTVHLFEDLFNFQLFPYAEGFKSNSQVPPSDKAGQDKASDIATKYVDDRYKWHMFCFSEAKRAKNTSQSKIRAVETQAQGYCKEFLESHPEVNMVYANTLVGASIRCWSYKQGDSKLRGFWNGDEKDHFEHYRDVGEDENVAQLEDAIANMKSIPTGVLRRGQDHSQIGASSSNYYSSAALPLRSNAPDQLYGGQESAPSIPPDSDQQAMERSAGPSDTPLVSDFQSTSALQNENYVEVTLVKPGQDIANNTYQFQTHIGTVQKLGSEFTELTDPEGFQCMGYYGSKSKIWYWTRSLDPESGYVVVYKGKGKEKRKH